MSSTSSIVDVSPHEVDFADFNPRQETAEQIDADASFAQLKDSVFKYGVLVPIVVHKRASPAGAKLYRLVDGERRLLAALATNQPTIPARIADSSSPLDDVGQAFHIHMLRRQWENVAQARALRRLLDGIGQTPETASSSVDVMDSLIELTGCTRKELQDLIRAIRYSDDVLSEVDSGTLKWSHLVQIEASLVEQVKQNFPGMLARRDEAQLRECMLKKARRGVLSSTRALMQNVVPVVARAHEDQQETVAERLIEEFITTEEMPAEEVLKRYERESPDLSADVLETSQRVQNTADDLTALVNVVPWKRLAGYPEAVTVVLSSLKTLKSALTKAIKAIKP